MARIFIDANVWFSAFYGSENCLKIIRAHAENKIKAVVSQKVIEESLINLRKKAPWALSTFKIFLSNSPPELVTDPESINPKIRKLVQFKDQPIFCSAISAKADYFVTGNIKDFNIKKLEKITGIKILTPNQAVDILQL